MLACHTIVLSLDLSVDLPFNRIFHHLPNFDEEELALGLLLVSDGTAVCTSLQYSVTL